MVENSVEGRERESFENVLQDAKQIAIEMGSFQCDTTHLLFATTKDPLVQEGMAKEGVDLESLKMASEFIFGKPVRANVSDDPIEFTPRVRRLISELNTQAIGNNRPTNVLDLVIALVDPEFEGYSSFVYQGAMHKVWEKNDSIKKKIRKLFGR